MLLITFLFLSIRWLDVIDILLVATLLYQLYYLVRGTPAINIFIGMILFYLVWVVVKALDMELFSNILGKFIDVGIIALIIIFQQELRRFLLFIGTTEFVSKTSLGRNLLKLKWSSKKRQLLDVGTLVRACKNMAESRTGAIIVITTNSDLKFYANTGDIVDAKVSARMIESIFYKNSPLHDGAIIISNNQIKAARCVLPVTENPDFPATLGMRHRAAVGVTENSDAIAVVVSEQTGEISLARDGRLQHAISADELKSLLEQIAE